MLDSGAFSSWALGGRIKIDDYIDYIRRNEHLLHRDINLDVIPGSDRQREWRRDHIDKSGRSQLPQSAADEGSGTVTDPGVPSG